MLEYPKITCFLLISSLAIISCNKDQELKPNVVFILADDLGYHDLGITGSEYYETPNIDLIAKEGMIFTNGYAASQVCSPSRASILTGQFTARHGITDWIGAKSGEDWRKNGRHTKLLPPDYRKQLPNEVTVLPEALKSAGYKTFFAGKWHLGGEGSYPEDHGFDFNIGGYELGSPKGGYFSPYNNPKLQDGNPGENLSMRLARETVKFLEEHNPANTGQPVFAYLSFYAVHSPIQTTEQKWRKYRDKAASHVISEPGYAMGHFLPIRQHQDNPIYAGLVEAMDEAVGIVLNGLDQLGLAENTIVIFTSDNGGVVAGDNFSTSNKPLRGGKGYQYEGGIREPYFIKAPNVDPTRHLIDEPVSSSDLYPTILDLVGEDPRPQDHLDGKSLMPLMQGEMINDRSLIWHYPHYGNQGGRPSSIIRRGEWKLIHYYEDDTEALFNLEVDISESNDVKNLYPTKAQELHDELFNYLEEVGALYPKKDPLYDSVKEANYLQMIKTQKMTLLEAQRLKILDPNFQPNSSWWGSQPH